MTRSRRLVCDVTANLAFFLWLYALMALVAFLIHDDITASYRLLPGTAVFFTGCWCIRYFLPKTYLFLPLHFLWVAAVLFFGLSYPAMGILLLVNIPGTAAQFPVGVLFIIATVILSFTTRYSAQRNLEFSSGTVLVFMLVLALLCLICEYQSFNGPVRIMAVTAVMILVLKIIFTQISNIDQSLEVITHTSSQPVSFILPYNNRIIISFSLLALLSVLMVFYAVSATGAYDYLVERWRQFAGFFTAADREAPPWPEEISPVIETAPEAIDFEMLPDNTPLWLMLLLRGLMYFALGLTGVIFLIGMYHIVLNLYYYRFPAKRKEESASGDISESVLPAFTTVRERFGLRRSGPANPVRRQFYKKVRKYRQGKILDDKPADSDTAWEIAGKIRKAENLDTLTAQYEDIRYRR